MIKIFFVQPADSTFAGCVDTTTCKSRVYRLYAKWHHIIFDKNQPRHYLYLLKEQPLFSALLTAQINREIQKIVKNDQSFLFLDFDQALVGRTQLFSFFTNQNKKTDEIKWHARLKKSTYVNGNECEFMSFGMNQINLI